MLLLIESCSHLRVHTVMNTMMTRSVKYKAQKPQIIHKFRVDPELEQGVEFEVDQIKGRRQKESQREVKHLSSESNHRRNVTSAVAQFLSLRCESTAGARTASMLLSG
jgi:hypothetical protein